MPKIGVIGGSGLYNIEGLKKTKQVFLNTPFGKPSGKFITGILGGKEVVFLPRHDFGHRIPPTEVNYRANIFGMKKLGVDRIISISACGSLKESFKPMDFVVVDQFVDRTNSARKMSFSTKGLVFHVGLAHPVCGELSSLVFNSGKKLGLRIHPKGTYINMEGPAFSTLAESKLYRSWGMDIIAMTNFGEAKLAREAEICYASLASITDYDCWHKSHDSVTGDMIIKNSQKNIENAKKILVDIIMNMPVKWNCECQSALKDAIFTDRKFIPKKIKKDLGIIIGKYI